MSDIDAIRRGIAANLTVLKDADTFTARGLKPIGQVSPYMLDTPSPPSAMVSGIEADGIEYQGYGSGGGVAIVFLIEVCLGLVSDIGSQKLLNALLDGNGTTSLVAAVEADRRLTSRFGSDGTVTADEDPACDSLAFLGFRGQAPFTLRNRTEVLLATWAFRVLA